ncbi:MAG: hypothetical protein QOD11_3063 [Bradyrhizobium sp.]|jgi:hypothetical protein|nr:hypothetical protein [Bradyrhizobium sp.]
MTAEFSGKKFGWQAARRGAIFLALMFGVPLALYAADKIDDPHTDVTLTEAIRLTTATPVGFYAYLLLVLSLIRPIWKRMKSLCLSGYWGLIVPLLMLADLPYFLAAHSAGIFGVSISDPGGHLPLYFITAIALIIAMTVAQPPAAGEGHARRFGLVGAGAVMLAVSILLGVAFIVGMANWLHFIQNLGPDEAPHPLFVPMLLGSSWVSVLNPYACAVFMGLVAWCVVLSRRPERFSSAS